MMLRIEYFWRNPLYSDNEGRVLGETDRGEPTDEVAFERGKDGERGERGR